MLNHLSLGGLSSSSDAAYYDHGQISVDGRHRNHLVWAVDNSKWFGQWPFGVYQVKAHPENEVGINQPLLC